MLPERLIPAVIRAGKISPAFFSSADHPWLSALIDELDRFSGRPERALEAHLSLPLAHEAPLFKVRALLPHLRRLYAARIDSPIKPSLARETLFLAAAASVDGSSDHAAVVASVAAHHGIAPSALEHAIIADLPGERLIRSPDQAISAAALVQSMNDLIIRGLVGRAREITIRAEGSMRAIVRQAKLRGLLCTLREDAGSTALVINGPFSLFRHTLLYGRALGSLVARLPYCAKFELTATCQLRGELGVFTLRSSDGYLQATPGVEPRRFDSKVEAAFAKDFGRLAPDWDLLREPEAIQIGTSFIFPDFAVVNRVDPRRRCLMEIVGYWTTDYLTRKLDALRRTGRSDVILCLDEALACDDVALPHDLRVIRYRRRIPAEAVLAAVTSMACHDDPASLR